jgi:hypothetical protein
VTFFFLGLMVCAASYGPDEMIPSEGISGGYIKQFVPNRLHRWLLWFDFLIVYFLYLFIISMTEMFAAAATTSWFFTRKKESAYMPGLSVMLTVFQYHIGTVAKLAIYKIAFKVLRNCAAMLKSALRKGKQDNNFIRFLMATFLPVLTMYERFMKYISKDLFVITAMWGDNYLLASRKDFFMTKFRHPGDGYAIIPWLTYVLFSLKLSLSLIVAACVYFYCWWFSKSPLQNDLNPVDTPMVPFMFVFLTGLFFISVWIAPYDMMYRSILQCYSMDGEMFIGDQRFTEKFIQEFIDQLEETNEKVRLDRTFFCFECKKKRDKKVQKRDDNAEWTEDIQDLKDEAEMNDDPDDKWSDEEMNQAAKDGVEEDQGMIAKGGMNSSKNKDKGFGEEGQQQAEFEMEDFDNKSGKMTEMHSLKSSKVKQSAKGDKGGTKLTLKGTGEKEKAKDI